MKKAFIFLGRKYTSVEELCKEYKADPLKFLDWIGKDYDIIIAILLAMPNWFKYKMMTTVSVIHIAPYQSDGISRYQLSGNEKKELSTLELVEYLTRTLHFKPWILERYRMNNPQGIYMWLYDDNGHWTVYDLARESRIRMK